MGVEIGRRHYAEQEMTKLRLHLQDRKRQDKVSWPIPYSMAAATGTPSHANQATQTDPWRKWSWESSPEPCLPLLAEMLPPCWEAIRLQAADVEGHAWRQEAIVKRQLACQSAQIEAQQDELWRKEVALFEAQGI